MKDTPMVWCEACHSYHAVPRDKEHHKALKCFAPLPGNRPTPIADMFFNFQVALDAYTSACRLLYQADPITEEHRNDWSNTRVKVLQQYNDVLTKWQDISCPDASPRPHTS